MEQVKHVISILVDNKPGVLARVSGLFSRRGYNIDSLAVGPAETKTVSRISIVVHGNDEIVEQITKQLNKLPDIKKVMDLTTQNHVDRELVLFRLHANNKTRHEIMSMVKAFRAKVVDVGENSMVVEVTGNTDKINALESLFSKFGITEVVRTGKIVLSRGKK
jgi:acetolactate synthase-1/3 small subunit